MNGLTYQWPQRYRRELLTKRMLSLVLALITVLFGAASVTLALYRLPNMLHEPHRVDSSLLWEVKGLTIEWWLVVCLAISLFGKLIGEIRGQLMALPALILSLALYLTWAVWSSQVAENVLQGIGVTISFLIGGSILSKVMFVLLVLSLVWESAFVIAATLAARASAKTRR